jgi:hypothetical protein
MSSCDDCARSFFARLRALFGRRSRALAVGVFLLLSPIPIRPEEIEEHMHCMSKARMVQILERDQQPPGDPPCADEISADPCDFLK